MKVIPLSEGAFSIDKSKVFIPFDKDKDNISERAAGSLLVEIQPFLVITGNDIVLLDTGLGYTLDDMLQIHRNLAANGINPADVTKVLLSHLHKDHAGGIIHRSKDGMESLSFPNAEYFIHEDELNYASEKGSPSYVPDDFAFIKNSPALKLLKGEKGNINNEIRFKMTSGHSRFHIVFYISEQNDIVFYGGDVAPQLQQMKSRFIAKYDMDGKKCMELRTKWWEDAMIDHRLFLFYHDIKTPTLRR